MSRYKESRKATNKDDMYKDVLDRKGVRSITQYRVRRMKQVDEIANNLHLKELYKHG